MGNVNKLARCYERLNIQLSDLDNRKILQKKIYFLQEFGFNLGYNFGFYIYGPYSTDLTSDAFALHDQFEVARNTIVHDELFQNEIETLDRLDDFLRDIPEVDLARQLELLSSIHFLNNHIYQPILNVRLMIREIRTRKPGRFTDGEIRRAWNRLQRLDLIQVEES